MLLAVVLLAAGAAALVLARGGGRDAQRIPPVPVNPTAADLRAIGFREEHDGRFSPHGFGSTFRYPNDAYEMLASIPERGEHDTAMGITERRRHFLFAEGVNSERSAGDKTGTRALPIARIARITYLKPFTAERLTDFAARLNQEVSTSASGQKFRALKIDDRPALIARFKLADGAGHTLYVVSGGRLFQIITYSVAGEGSRESRVLKSLLSSARFDD